MALKNIGEVLKEALSKVDERQVLAAVRRAAELFVENEQRREFVVKELMLVGVPESIARLALEIAVQALKLSKDQ